jgi:hypothetical protein
VETVVYFIGAKAVGRVKIGYTDQLSDRFSALKTASPVPLQLLATIPGDRRIEAVLHARFAHHHTHGEWFTLHGEIQDYIKEVLRGLHGAGDAAAIRLVAEQKRRRICERLGPRRAFFEDAKMMFGNRWKRFLSVQLAIPMATMNQWESGATPIPGWVRRQVREAAAHDRSFLAQRPEVGDVSENRPAGGA